MSVKEQQSGSRPLDAPGFSCCGLYWTSAYFGCKNRVTGPKDNRRSNLPCYLTEAAKEGSVLVEIKPLLTETCSVAPFYCSLDLHRSNSHFSMKGGFGVAPVTETHSPVGLAIEMASLRMHGNRPFQIMRILSSEYC